MRKLFIVNWDVCQWYSPAFSSKIKFVPQTVITILLVLMKEDYHETLRDNRP